jgi:hypothetical protein
MNFKRIILFTVMSMGLLCLFPSRILHGHEIFIYRTYKEKKPLFPDNKLTLHGEFFGQLQLPSNFPSYNDLSGKDDRWTFGFRNRIFITENFSFLAQLVTHDDGSKRTKFDWHFSLRLNPLENLVLILGHDSNHDSDYQSTLDGFAYFLNRNYVGFGLPFQTGDFYFEPFTWLLYHTNQTGHLDLSGEKVLQEYGIRLGTWIQESFGMSLQIVAQSESFFSLGQTFLADLIIRVRIFDHMELSAGGSIWKDIQESSRGNKQTFFKLHWGIAIPF